MESRVSFHINDLSSICAIAAPFRPLIAVRLLRCIDGSGLRGDLDGRARAGVVHRISDLLDDSGSLLATLSGHSDLACGNDHEAHGLALRGLQVGIEGLDGAEAEVVVGALQGHPEKMADALGVGPCAPLSGECMAFDEGFERLPVMPDGSESSLLAFGAFEGRSCHGMGA